MRKALFIIFGSGAFLALLINLILKDPVFNDPIEKIRHSEQTNQLKIAEDTYRELLEKEPYNIDYHYFYIRSHFRQPLINDEDQSRDDDSISDYYQNLRTSEDHQLKDIGIYGSGLIFNYLDNYKAALFAFLEIKNKSQKYLNNSIGMAYLYLDDEEKAVQFFKKEIQYDGNLDGAYHNLSSLLLRTGQYDKLEQLLNDENAKKHIPFGVQKSFYFRNGNYLKYNLLLLKVMVSHINLIGFLGAFLILCIWVIYIKKLDIYNPENWKHITLALGLGMLFSFGTDALSDINEIVFGLKLNGNIINDFVYAVVGIGVVEELVKIIPLLLLIRFTKAINESYDYILYASLSALGFAFIENLLYFNEYQLNIISGRAIITSIAHMFMSSIVAYGFILNKYRYNSHSVWRLLLFFALASFGHGFYDFWLINEKVGMLSMLSVLFFLSSVFMWNSLKNNALNNSEFYNESKHLDHKKLSVYLVYCLSGVILFEYLALSIKFGPSIGNDTIISSVFSGGYLIVFIAVSLGRMNLEKDKWYRIRFWGVNKPENT